MVIDDTLKKFKLKRNDPVGKRMGTRIYVHRQYQDLIVIPNILASALRKAGDPDDYTAIRYDTISEEIAFQWSAEFDWKDEPAIDKIITVKSNGEIRKKTLNPDNPQIWHHKWMWVLDEYKGFNVLKSKQRSLSWIGKTEKGDSSRIGYRNYWESFLTRVG